MSKKKTIKPKFYYDEKKRPVLVRLSVEDFDTLYSELKKLSAAAKKQVLGKKVLK